MGAPTALALIPARAGDVMRAGRPLAVDGQSLLAWAVKAAREARCVQRTVVSTDAAEVRDLAVSLGAEVPFLRPASLTAPGVPMEDVLRHAIKHLAPAGGSVPTAVVLLEPAHPFRPPGLVDGLVGALADQNLDTVFCAVEERAAFWSVDEHGNLERVDQRDRDTRASRRPLYRELAGLGLAVRTEVARRGERLGQRVGVLPVPARYGLIDTQVPIGFALAQTLGSKLLEEEDS